VTETPGGRLAGRPDHFALQITGRCNLNCPDCYRTHEPRDMSLTEIVTLAAEMRDRGFGWVALGGGEPTLHSALPAITRAMHDLGLRVSLATNGTEPAAVRAAEPDAITVSPVAEGWYNYPDVCPEIPVGVNIIVGRGGGEPALETAILAARRGFSNIQFLPLHGVPDAFPAREDLELLMLAEPWLAEMGAQGAVGCAALRLLGVPTGPSEAWRLRTPRARPAGRRGRPASRSRRTRSSAAPPTTRQPPGASRRPSSAPSPRGRTLLP